MQLVIVESPAKAKTINKYLGKDYEVLASFGHVRDLAVRDGSVDPANDFAMDWEVSADRSRQLKEIAEAAKRADSVILATDPDREGEAISWHLTEWLHKKKLMPKGGAQRVTFNAITKDAVTAAMARPRALDDALIDAYRARRALDYLVGFTLSPVLWRKLPGARSAGRVQSVALRLVCERESEIEAHSPREYWTVTARMATAMGEAFAARLAVLDDKKLEQFDLSNEALAQAARARVEAATFTVSSVETKPATRNPYAPFTTSTLQQEASKKLGLSADQTMRLAQQLYEAGRITYMRTDGVQMAPEAIAAVRAVIGEDYGRGLDTLPEKPRHYATKAKNAQEAHEAIRPTDLFARPARTPLNEADKLYALIWKRTVASQMASARMERTSVLLEDTDRMLGLRASGQVMVSPGFLAVYTETREDALVDDDSEDSDDDRRLPRLAVRDACATRGADAKQSFTQPPPRYSEASLVKRMEELGIGRPSTYASILQVLKDRAYVRMEAKRFYAEEKGRLLTAFLERFFDTYVGYDYTAGLEAQLDEVSAGNRDWLSVMRAFWADFEARTKEVLDIMPSEVTKALDDWLEPMLFPEREDGEDPRLCPACNAGRLGLRTGKFGAFVGCSNYPECRYTRQFGGDGAARENNGPMLLGIDPATGEPVTKREGRFGAYVQIGEDEKPPRASIPRDMVVNGPEDLSVALQLLSLPRSIGPHPETGEPITASIGRYGPYLAHAGKYAKLANSAEVFETGMNTAVVKLAEAAAGRPARGTPQPPLRELGEHPATGAAIKLLNGRFGPYFSDGTTNANVPKGQDGMTITLEEAAALIDARAAMPSKGKKKPAKKAAAKKPAAKTAAAKKAPAKKKAAVAKKAAGKQKAAAKTVD